MNLDRERSKTLGAKFEVEGIPSLVVLNSSCEVLVSDGVGEVRAAPDQVFNHWSQAKRLFWSREAKQGEHSWEDLTCSECYMNPILGKRYGCTQRDCDLDLCETCFSKAKHDHPLVEYLIPKQHYSLEQLFQSVPYLLQPNNEEKLETKTLWENGGKTIGFYFSAHWCPPCRAFTPKLAEIYKEAQAISKSFRIVFVSSDRDEDSFKEYRSTMPWPAVPLNHGALIKSYFQCSGKKQKEESLFAYSFSFFKVFHR